MAVMQTRNASDMDALRKLGSASATSVRRKTLCDITNRRRPLAAAGRVEMTTVKQEEADTASDINGGQITHGKLGIHHLDEFSHHIVCGNIVKLYNHNVHRLRKIIHSTTTPDRYYVCHMTKTFATDGKRMFRLRCDCEDSFDYVGFVYFMDSFFFLAGFQAR
uniref:Uncharacterized protein n=1 Tax=Aegilops tauschii TaxID=37682 RepID=M8C0W0_AEGTA